MRTLIIVLVAGIAPACIPSRCDDSDCIGGNVCAADGQCRAPDELEPLIVTWTIAGQPASAATCDGQTMRVGFVEGFGRDTDELEWSGIDCTIGAFERDDVPSYDEVELGYDTGDDFAHASYATPDGSGTTAFDLPMLDGSGG
jgi:hypothetical protein